MSASMCRYEILLPRRFNDGSAVPDELTGVAILTLRELPALARHVDRAFQSGHISVGNHEHGGREMAKSKEKQR